MRPPRGSQQVHNRARLPPPPGEALHEPLRESLGSALAARAARHRARVRALRRAAPAARPLLELATVRGRAADAAAAPAGPAVRAPVRVPRAPRRSARAPASGRELHRHRDGRHRHHSDTRHLAQHDGGRHDARRTQRDRRARRLPPRCRQGGGARVHPGPQDGSNGARHLRRAGADAVPADARLQCAAAVSRPSARRHDRGQHRHRHGDRDECQSPARERHQEPRHDPVDRRRQQRRHRRPDHGRQGGESRRRQDLPERRGERRQRALGGRHFLRQTIRAAIQSHRREDAARDRADHRRHVLPRHEPREAERHLQADRRSRKDQDPDQGIRRVLGALGPARGPGALVVGAGRHPRANGVSEAGVNPDAPVAAAAQQAGRFAAPIFLWLLLGIPVAIAAVSLGWRSRRKAQATWAGSLFERLTPELDRGRERLRFALYLVGYVFVVLALARPQWGGETVMMKRKGIDLLIAMDTSTSMLAEDMRPNRLASAKRAVADLVRRMGGDRVGLIAFAGEAYTVCPLTLDHGTVLLFLESMSPNSVSVPGTDVEDAIRRARASFVKEEHKHKALVIVTDGESTTGDAEREAKQAAEDGVVLFTIGIGSPDGQPIPERDDNGNVTGYKRDRAGNVVNSRLDEDGLRRIADATHGHYFRASPQGVELSTVYNELQSMEKKELEGQLATNYEERYQWPLGLAALLLGAEMVVPYRRRREAA